MMKTRSLHGCWTCRIRRKKCDEQHPSCSVCSSLDIKCHGYGPRPNWMDGGVQEKEQSLKIKQSVKQATKKRLRGLSDTTLPSPESGIIQLATPPQSSEPSISTIVSSPLTTVDLAFSDYSPSSISENNFDAEWPWGSSMSTFDLSGAVSSTRSEQSADANEKLVYNQKQFHVPTTFDLILAQDLSLCSERMPSLHHSPTSTFGEETTFRIANQRDSNDSASNLDHVEPSNNHGSSFAFDFDGVAGSAPRNELWTPSLAHRSHDSEEAALFMHYMDEVFYIQFPLYAPSDGEDGRGWLLRLLTGDESVHSATLALSQVHRRCKQSDSITREFEIISLKATSKYHVYALRQLQMNLRESQHWCGTTGNTRVIHTVACILQLLFFETFSCANSSWSVHLQALASFAPQLARKHIFLSDRRAEDPTTRAEPQYTNPPSLEDSSALAFLLGTALWLDILASVSQRASPFLNINHNLLLSTENVRLGKYFGCENWVLSLLLRINALDMWKQESERNGKLSIAELARRGAQVQAELEQRLGEIPTHHNSPTKLFHNNRGSLPDDTRAVVTRSFALASLTYLHVVVSGAHPELPEITDSVSRTINALEVLSQRNVLHTVAWPFCVTGCLISDEKRIDFRALIPIAKTSESTLGTLILAIKVIEQCWEDRKSGFGSMDWRSSMESMGQYILLV